MQPQTVDLIVLAILFIFNIILWRKEKRVAKWIEISLWTLTMAFFAFFIFPGTNDLTNSILVLAIINSWTK
jgi:hypothetical protein